MSATGTVIESARVADVQQQPLFEIERISEGQNEIQQDHARRGR